MLEAGERAFLFRRRFALDLRRGVEGERDVDAGTMLAVLHAKRGRHRRAPVAALRAVTRVTEPVHQPGPGRGDAIDAPAGGLRLAGEPKARQRWTDDVEGIGGSADGSFERTCRKWMSSPSISVVNCSKRLSFASRARQS